MRMKRRLKKWQIGLGIATLIPFLFFIYMVTYLKINPPKPVEGLKECFTAYSSLIEANDGKVPESPYELRTEPENFIVWWETKLNRHSEYPVRLVTKDYVIIPNGKSVMAIPRERTALENFREEAL